MITPADLARMLGQTPDSTDNHTQYQLLYTSQTPQNSADSKQSDDTVDNVAGTDTQSADHADETAEVSTKHSMPTPATVFGMHATVTIATSSETIEGQADGIDSEAETESIAQSSIETETSPAPIRQEPSQPIHAQTGPTPATVFGRRAADTTPTPTGPTPAMMPQRRTSDGPTTFASLDAQELPVVREYSAGGLIFDDQNRVAIIARHSRSGHLEWCLPKGHIEKGETPQQTAVREVHEETGILGEVIDSIATIDYWFTGTTQRVHKLVHHYALRQTGGELTVEGDPDHEAEDAIWVRFDDLDDVLSYPNERKIAWLYARKKNRQANE